MNLYVIYELKAELFWSNRLGWADFKSATKFTEDEVDNGISLMGYWIPIKIKSVD